MTSRRAVPAAQKTSEPLSILHLQRLGNPHGGLRLCLSYVYDLQVRTCCTLHLWEGKLCRRYSSMCSSVGTVWLGAGRVWTRYWRDKLVPMLGTHPRPSCTWPSHRTHWPIPSDIIIVGYFMMLSVAGIYSRIVGWIMNYKGFGRKLSWTKNCFCGVPPPFVCIIGFISPPHLDFLIVTYSVTE
jgi:hypothetical protein